MARYFRRTDGQSFWAIVPSIATIATPSAAEINAGTNITARISEVSGFAYKNEPIETPDLSTAFVSTIPGEDKAEDCSLILYDDTTNMALWTALAKGTSTYIVINDYAKATGSKTRVWTVVSLGPNDEYTLDATSARFMVDFTVSTRPNLDATFPAGVTI